MLTKEAVWLAIEELFVRLPKLLEERQSASPTPSQAYPTTIRLTARVVDPTLTNARRRPFRTQSRQCSFDGKMYMSSDGPTRKNMLQVIIAPLLKALVLENPEAPRINVTRMNIAATNFQDLALAGSFASGSIESFVSQDVKLSQSKSQSISSPQTKKRDRDEPTRCQKNLQRETGKIDLSILAELPPDIAAEVKQMYQQQEKKSKKRQTIDSFFRPKS
jgi:hypothetical protein